MKTDKIDFESVDGRGKVVLGQGRDCVLISIDTPRGGYGGIVVTPKTAREIARSLKRRAKYAEQS